MTTYHIQYELPDGYIRDELRKFPSLSAVEHWLNTLGAGDWCIEVVDEDLPLDPKE